MTVCRNLITDVSGLRVGNATDLKRMSGVTVILPDRPAVAAIDVRGGGPGTRDSDALGLTGSVDAVHAIVLSGGSAFGLSAASGVQGLLRERDIGFPVGDQRVPIVPEAVVFDLLNGGDKAWGARSPYEDLAREAAESAAEDFALGSIGAGYGATTANLRGGLGSASESLPGGLVIGALVVVNAVGSVTIGDTQHFWAAPFERNAEFGGRGMPSAFPIGARVPQLKSVRAGESTTIAVIATNARLDKRQAHRLAVMAQTGLARAITPVHTPLDGDAVFALATGDVALDGDTFGALAVLGAHAANVMARAVARAVYEAAAAPIGWAGPPAYATHFAHSGKAAR